MDIDARQAQRLFQAVVAQALIDACSVPHPKALASALKGGVKRRKNENDLEYEARRQKTIDGRVISLQRHIDEARAWLLGNNDAFREVVSLAGYNPDDIRERAGRLAARGWPAPPKATLAEVA